jgi:hypothetical protein
MGLRELSLETEEVVVERRRGEGGGRAGDVKGEWRDIHV